VTVQRRIVLLAAALVVALAGTTLIFSYFNRQPAAAQDAEVGATALVATALIPAGTTGQGVLDQGLVEMTEIPAGAVVPGALTDLSLVTGKVTAADIQPGEQLLGAKFVDPGTVGALPVPDDKVAVSVEVASDALRVANFVKPGVEVTVFDTYPVVAPESAPGQPVVDKETWIVVDRALVLAVGSTTAAPVATAPADGSQPVAPANTTPTSTVTFAVSIDDAQDLVHASQTGTITLGLLTDKSRTGTGGPDDSRTIFE
jgi:pilus assembly protein CpaB